MKIVHHIIMNLVMKIMMLLKLLLVNIIKHSCTHTVPSLSLCDKMKKKGKEGKVFCTAGKLRIKKSDPSIISSFARFVKTTPKKKVMLPFYYFFFFFKKKKKVKAM
ncbi:hypothetical protein BJ944DRAFT_234095 [Cunninghamella echinulata]|nr:hypothetical protein BJ944DRAFT_234095 [Cunninghamella echinulata]